MTKQAKLSKGQISTLKDMADGSDFIGAYAHATCVSLVKKGLVEAYLNDHGMERRRITEAGRKAVGA